jgi:RNA polymerase sigma-70 factor (ECF subfamily)
LIPTLKPEYAEIITLDLKEVDSGDIADQLGITKDNIKVRRHRAREQLKKRLEETCKICAKHGCFDCDCKRSE